MPVASQHRSRLLSEQQRLALKVLAAADIDGVTEDMFAFHGVGTGVLVELVNAGLASVTVEKLGRPRIEITRVTITDSGRAAIGSGPYNGR